MELLIISLLLIIAVETTYVSVRTVRKEQKTTSQPVFVDTSVLIDGRIIAIAESGFLTRPLYIPRSVVGELQFLADNADAEKRSRARHGLDIISQLQGLTSVTVHIFPDGVKAEEGVDNRLLMLAKKHHGALCTIDYNLNKVAVVENIEVLNVNELAKTLRMAYLPGERLRLELTQKGNDQHQAVGHLEDGTMVVVEHAYKQIGKIVEVEFIRSLQTAAGKMMFAKLTQTERERLNQSSVAKQSVTAPVLKGTKPKITPKATSKNATRQPQQRSTNVTKTDTVARPQARRQQQRRRTTPEDNLVALANKQD